MKQAVLLAGGKGTRLAERLNGRPKPLIDVDGVPLLERQVRELARFGVEEAVVLVNHAADQIEDFFKRRGDLGCRVLLVDDGQPLGTAGATLACLDRLDERFLVIYGDTLFNIDITRFVKNHCSSGADVTLFLHPNDHPQDSDLVELDADGRILAFHSYPHPPNTWLPNLVNAAFYAVERSALSAWRNFPTPSDFAKDLFPAMIGSGARLHGYRSFEYIKDLGTPRRLDKVELHLRRGVVARARLDQLQACVFLDRDGTLGARTDCVRGPDEFVLLPGAEEAVKLFNDAEYRVALVTNEDDAEPGEVTVQSLRGIRDKLDTQLGAAGAFIDLVLDGSYLVRAGNQDEPFGLACAHQEPETALLEQASRELNADPSCSWMVSDNTADIRLANLLGLRSILVDTGNRGGAGEYERRPDFMVENVLEAARLITTLHPRIEAITADLVRRIRPGDLVVIAGLARSGKSTLASSIVSALLRQGISSQSISLDRWIRSLDQRASGVVGRYDLDAALAALAPWLEGFALDADLPVYDRLLRASGPEGRVKLGAEEALVLEGVPGLLVHWPTARPTHTIYVEVDEADRSARVIDDIVRRGVATADEARAIYEGRIVDEVTPVRETYALADVVVRLNSDLS